MNDLDLLERCLARVVGRDDTPADWHVLHADAAHGDRIWRELALALEDDMLVRTACRATSATAVGLPVAAGPFAVGPVAVASARHGARPWLGWCAAAVLAVAWSIDHVAHRAPGGGSSAAPADPTVALADPTVAFADPTVSPRSASVELPRIVLATGPMAADGSVEITYVRRTVERARVQQVEAIAVDDRGATFATPRPTTQLAAARSL